MISKMLANRVVYLIELSTFHVMSLLRAVDDPSVFRKSALMYNKATKCYTTSSDAFLCALLSLLPQS